MMNDLIKPFKEAAKSFTFKYTKLGAPKYPYNIEPMQLATMISELDRLKEVKGNIVEIGVARGMTTRFLAEHIVNQNLQESMMLFAIDTFESFVKKDLEYEVKHRGKSMSELKGFSYNDYKTWQKNFIEFPFIKALKADCSSFDYDKVAPVKLALLDVDLYIPIKNALSKLFDVTVKGGIILVDDVKNNSIYDGAYQAYMEFCKNHSIKPIIIGTKCGVIYKD